MKARKDKFPFLQLHQPWAENSNPIWLASTLTLHRNLRAYSFPSKLGTEERQQIFNLVSREVLKSSVFEQSWLVKAEEIGPLEKEFLFEHYLQRYPFQQALTGEGFVLEPSGTLLALLNIDDHVQMQITDIRGELEAAWNRLAALEAGVGSSLTYAFTPRFGFLTAQPRHCGTGLVTRTFLHLPALIRTKVLDSTLEKLGEDEVEAASIQGRLDEIVGDILTITNRCAIGLNDEQVLQSVRTYVTKLMLEEKRCRARIGESKATDIKDLVSRAFGILRHSYQLDVPEAWGAISLLKLGQDLGWVKGTTQAALNELLFASRRAHLVCEYSEELSHDELPHRRAEFLHASLAQADLQI